MSSVNKKEYQTKLDELFKRIKKLINDPEFLPKFSQSVDATSRIILTISNTNNNHWAAEVVDNEGNPLFTDEDEQRKYEEAFKPFVESIRNTFKHINEQDGGVELLTTDQKISTDQIIPQSSKLDDTLKKLDPDELFNSFIQSIGSVDRSLKQFSSNYGIIKLQNDYDKKYKNDVHLIPQSITTLFPSQKLLLDQIKLPLRFIIFVIFLYLDVSRIMAAMSGLVTTQKILSSVLALLEFLRGDWKKSLLTFVGIFGTTPLLVGQFIKTFLYLFEKLSPTLQERIVYGSWDAIKSFTIGVLLSILQVTAPFQIREKISNALSVLREAKKGIDGDLEEAGYKPRQDFFSPTWDDLNNLQAVNDDPVFICSKEYTELIDSQSYSPLLRIIFELFRIPINKDMRKKYTCSDFPSPPKPYLELLKQNRQSTISTSETISTPKNTLTENSEQITDQVDKTKTQVMDQVMSPINATSRMVENTSKAVEQKVNSIGSLSSPLTRRGGKSVYNKNIINKL